MNTPWYGFNLLWMVSAGWKEAPSLEKIHIDLKDLDFMAAMGCNFVRIPLDYRFWIHDFAYDAPKEAFLAKVDECVEAVVSRGMHCSLNIHRAPGYCINGNELEKHNLWLDGIAQDAFCAQWTGFASRYAHIPSSALSFDLLNEPPNIGQYGMTRDIHEGIMRRVIDGIRSISPDRPITLDGLGGGNIAMPELADLAGQNVMMSTRGYQPMALTHYQANWCVETKGLPLPVYPGTEYDGSVWDRERIKAHYAPWKKLSDRGVPVHIGEFGCYDTIDNRLALAWFEDVLSIFKDFGWGYALWNLKGAFGIVGHRRPNTRWEEVHGYLVDRDLYELLLSNRVSAR